MKQSYILKVAAKSFVVGAVICLCFYTVIRVMFWDFQFSFAEEARNLFTIVSRGGLMFAGAAVIYILFEKVALSRLSGREARTEAMDGHSAETLPNIMVAARQ